MSVYEDDDVAARIDGRAYMESPSGRLEEGALVIMLTRENDLVFPQQTGKIWELQATQTRHPNGVQGAKLRFYPYGCLFTVLRKGEYVGFKALGAEGKTVQAVSREGYPHRVNNHNFGPWEMWESTPEGYVNKRFQHKMLGYKVKEIAAVSMEDIQNLVDQSGQTIRRAVCQRKISERKSKELGIKMKRISAQHQNDLNEIRNRLQDNMRDKQRLEVESVRTGARLKQLEIHNQLLNYKIEAAESAQREAESECRKIKSSKQLLQEKLNEMNQNDDEEKDVIHQDTITTEKVEEETIVIKGDEAKEEILTIGEKVINEGEAKEEILATGEKVIKDDEPKEEILATGEKVIKDDEPKEEILAIGEKVINEGEAKEEILATREKVINEGEAKEEILATREKVINEGEAKEEILAIGEKVINEGEAKEEILATGEKVIKDDEPKEEILTIGEKVINEGEAKEEILTIGEKVINEGEAKEEILTIGEKVINEGEAKEEILATREKVINEGEAKEEILTIGEKVIKDDGPKEEILTIGEKVINEGEAKEEILTIGEKVINEGEAKEILATREKVEKENIEIKDDDDNNRM